MADATTKASATDNLNEAARAAKAQTNVALPGSIVSYDIATQSATVHIAPCFRRKDPDQGGAVVCYQPPDIPGVPVWFPGGGDFSMHWPLSPGDTGLIIFCDRSTDEWKSEGGTDVEPQDLRRHNISDAVFLPGLRSFAAPLGADSLHNTAMVIRAAEIRLGSSAATDFVALASLVLTELGAIWTAMNAHTHPGVTVGGGITGPSTTTGSASAVAASKVKAE